MNSAETSIPWMTTDDAETALFQAIWDIKIGNKTDDKLILENLRKSGVWLVRFEPKKRVRGPALDEGLSDDEEKE